ncbi:MAG: hypothetical protein AB8G05_27320 [Oligoflexales bacterium]
MYNHLFLLSLFLSSHALASMGFKSSSKVSPQDYLYKSYSPFEDPLFNRQAPISLDVEVGVTSDCGKINFKSTMQAALKNILNANYLQNLGQGIIAASPMLTVCYMSPTWCAILKQFRLRASFLTDMRLKQCQAINRFIDQRVSNFYQERSQCVRGQIDAKSGNFEEAMDVCNNSHDRKLTDWAGKRVDSLKILEDTAKWAGLNSTKGDQLVGLVKSMIGEDIIKQDRISVDYGPRRMNLTPRTYLLEIKQAKHRDLCEKLLHQITDSDSRIKISDQELKQISGGNQKILDRQTLMSLAFLPFQKRQIYCRELSDALAVGEFNEDMSKTLDFIASKVGTNPNISTEHQENIARKRGALKDQIELTQSIERTEGTPLNKILFQINQEGEKFIAAASKRQLGASENARINHRVDGVFFDCADGIGCSR